jgi:hypothetical protein
MPTVIICRKGLSCFIATNYVELMAQISCAAKAMLHNHALAHERLTTGRAIYPNPLLQKNLLFLYWEANIHPDRFAPG